MEKKEHKPTNPVTRRDFIKGFGGGAVGAAIVPKLLAQESESLQTKSGKIPVYSRKKISMTVNGVKQTLMVEPRETLLDVLRENLNLTGTKKICDQGECGGCTVLIDGDPVYSCLCLAIRVDGKSVQTIEGLADGKDLHPVQKAFIDNDAYQCGFCSPGFIMSIVAFLEERKNSPSMKDMELDEVKKALSGNICRCGNYAHIYRAVTEAAQKMGRS